MSSNGKQLESTFIQASTDAKALNNFVAVLNGLKTGWRNYAEEIGLDGESYDRWSFLDDLKASSGFWVEDFIDNAEEAHKGLEVVGKTSRFFPKLKKLKDVATYLCPSSCQHDGLAVMRENRYLALKTISTHVVCLVCRAVTQVDQRSQLLEPPDRVYRYGDGYSSTDSSLDDV